MLVKTRLQTVEITFKNSQLTFHSIEQYPPLNEELRDKMMRCNQPVQIVDDDGDTYTWWMDGRCVVETADGVEKLFWPVVTMNDAVKYGWKKVRGIWFQEPTGFFQFHGDGSVTCSAWGNTYYWSNERLAEEIQGEWMETEWDTEVKDWVFNSYRTEEGYESADSYMTYDSTGHLYSYRRGRRMQYEDII